MDLNAGDKIEMVSMGNDPRPIPAGTKGTVTGISELEIGGQVFQQVSVDWESGRTLMVLLPEDRIRKIAGPHLYLVR